MKSVDLHKFTKMVHELGYRIARSTRHHYVEDRDGNRLPNGGFAIHHAKGDKDFVLQVYVKRIMQAIEEDVKRKEDAR